MLIFDEAHNIEDVCREAASCEVDMATMIEVGWNPSLSRFLLFDWYDLIPSLFPLSPLLSSSPTHAHTDTRKHPNNSPPRTHPHTPPHQVAGSLNKALACNGKPEVYGPLVEACSRVLSWMQHKENEAVAVSGLVGRGVWVGCGWMDRGGGYGVGGGGNANRGYGQCEVRSTTHVVKHQAHFSLARPASRSAEGG